VGIVGIVAMTQNGRAYVAEKDGDDFWLLWWFPPGSDESTTCRIYAWADLIRSAHQLGFDLSTLRWAGKSMQQMIAVLGPPPQE
jgi:hypothetical protein